MPPTSPLDIAAVDLVPVVAQDHLTGEVRMVAFANVEAVRRTFETGRATFFSRSRGELWEKGLTSGNALDVHAVLLDCDGDALVYLVAPRGPTCHTGATSCFFRRLEWQGGSFVARDDEVPRATLLGRLERVLEARKRSDARASYVKSLYDGGPTAIAAKVREEADELARAVESENDARVVSEAADLLFHVLVALRARGVAFVDVLAALERRSGTSGHDEKASRVAGGEEKT